MIEPLTSTHIRRFILGRQGLWPGRRWSGKEGTASALRTAEAVQVDPVSVVAPSYDIVLWGRVDEYKPVDLRTLLYQERQFFDHGGGLFIYPMEELPYWRVRMERCKLEPRWAEFADANPELLLEVRAELRDRGPLRNRDLSGKAVTHYRGSKETSVALYYLWLTGELLTHNRDGKERVYDFLENVAPDHLQHVAEVSAAEEFHTQKSMRLRRLITPRRYRNIRKDVTGQAVDAKQSQAELAQRVESGELFKVDVSGSKIPYYILAEDLELVATIQAGEIPAQWDPLDTTTKDEVVFLSPLEYVSARGRAKELFNFDYIWEIYKPAAKRQYGPYTMPLLYGDQLVARMDAKIERKERTLIINGLWLEEEFMPDDRFSEALGKGLSRFMAMIGADKYRLENPLPFFK